jgi:YVTN family beta-propeller protein
MISNDRPGFASTKMSVVSSEEPEVDQTNTKPFLLVLAGLCLGSVAVATALINQPRMGRQPDGAFVVSTGQRIEADAKTFVGRPSDLAVHPSGKFYAVMGRNRVFLGNAERVDESAGISLGSNAGFHGIIWSPDGSTLYASTQKGHVQEFSLAADGKSLVAGKAIMIVGPEVKGNPVPGGMDISRDGKTLYVVSAERNSVVQLDLSAQPPKIVRELPVENVPYEVRITPDGKSLLVSNWGGPLPKEGDRTGKSHKQDVVVNERQSVASGTVSLIDLASGKTEHVAVGVHPTAIAFDGTKAYVANAMSDSVSELDLTTRAVARTFELRYKGQRLLGAMPNALGIAGGKLFAADGGDNAVAEIDLATGELKGFRPVGYFPIAIGFADDGTKAFVLNSKGNGSVARTTLGRAGNAHDFQGTVSVLDLSKPIGPETEKVAANNRWNLDPRKPGLKVYEGAIEHVIYIIKENRTYDEVFGDLPQGNGDPSLSSLGARVMPNHQKLATQFTLFDNAYVSGTNSADGHAWSTQAMATEYLEHFYVGYSRTYPDDAIDAMAISSAGALWDNALDHGKTLRIYGEACDDEQNRVEPAPKDWFEVWEDRKNGGGKFQFVAVPSIPRLKPYTHPNYMYWPLWQSDQDRADKFIAEYEQMSKENRVPNLMILSLPCDHAEGLNPRYPTPRAMMADNDLALGRIVEAVTKSPQWAKTCIMVIEDDAQAGPDHVDGHRTPYLAISPYTKRGYVDSSFHTTTSMIRSIELMLGLPAMNRFDAMAYPLESCFTDTPDLTPFKAVPANIALDERNPSGKKMTALDKYWQEKTLELDWSHIDAPDPFWLNRINWYSFHGDSRPYPGRPGDAPGQFEEEEEREEEERRQGMLSEDD